MRLNLETLRRVHQLRGSLSVLRSGMTQDDLAVLNVSLSLSRGGLGGKHARRQDHLSVRCHLLSLSTGV